VTLARRVPSNSRISARKSSRMSRLLSCGSFLPAMRSTVRALPSAWGSLSVTPSSGTPTLSRQRVLLVVHRPRRCEGHGKADCAARSPAPLRRRRRCTHHHRTHQVPYPASV
jgi:hypothetical protein